MLFDFFDNIGRGKNQVFGVFVEILSCPIRYKIETSNILCPICKLFLGDYKNPNLYELIDGCGVIVKPLFLPVESSESHKYGFLITAHTLDEFYPLSIDAISLGMFLDNWSKKLKEIYGDETCGYKPCYPNPRAMLLDKFIEAKKNNKIFWHE